MAEDKKVHRVHKTVPDQIGQLAVGLARIIGDMDHEVGKIKEKEQKKKKNDK